MIGIYGPLALLAVALDALFRWLIRMIAIAVAILIFIGAVITNLVLVGTAAFLGLTIGWLLR